MRLEHYPIDALKREIVAIAGRHLDLSVYRMFFFGSRVTGTSSERSDIDVGIEGPAEVPLNALWAIREEIDELPTLYSIDVIDFSVVSEGFKKVALENTEPLV